MTGKYGLKFDDILEMMIYIIPISIIFARLYYVVFKFTDYLNDPMQILNIRNGGLAIYGGVIGSVLVIVVFCKIKKLSILDVLDFAVPFFFFFLAIFRFQNFFILSIKWKFYQ